MRHFHVPRASVLPGLGYGNITDAPSVIHHTWMDRGLRLQAMEVRTRHISIKSYRQKYLYIAKETQFILEYTHINVKEIL